MKILMLTPYLPYPPSSGGQIRSYNLIKHLAKQHQITLFALIKFEEEKKFVKELEQYCHQVYVFKRATNPWSPLNILKTGFSLYPFLVVRNFSQQEKQTLRRLLSKEKFDLIHAETFYVCPHIPQTDIPLIVVDQTIEYQVYQHFVEHFPLFFLRPLLMVDVWKIKFWESYYWRKADRVVAVSERDARVMEQIVPDLKVTIVPNGVGEDLMDKIGLHYNQTILFMGNYAWLQNVEAARILAKKVFPLVKEKLPGSKLLIAGQNTAKIADLAEDNIQVVDLAIDDIVAVKKAYHTSGVLVAPLYGPGGTRLKILGAMAAKLPVVTTPIGIEGIEAKDGKEVLIGKTPRELAYKTVKLLRDKKLYQLLAREARLLVEKKYTYEQSTKILNKLYEEVAKT